MTTATPGPPPATGAWRPGDPPGNRQFVTLFEDEPLRLEMGGTLSPVVVAYETWGELDRAKGNGVLVAHALTGDSHAAGPAGPGHRYAGYSYHADNRYYPDDSYYPNGSCSPDDRYYNSGRRYQNNSKP